MLTFAFGRGVDWTHSMNNALAREFVGFCHFRIAGIAAIEGPAFFDEFRAGSTVDSL